ncbi:MAG TPA: hypothetical protein VM871_05680, partial [Flavisolibacter sp.]|nr:hypothetical protein [Flavisolibacter sp.]
MKNRNLFLLSSLLTTLLLTSSCSKQNAPEEQKPETQPLSSKDPQAISAATKVWHGERIQGSAPVPKGSALQLDATASAPTTLAFSGRYAILQPAVAQGDVAGYYLQFSKAKEYFKIDYSKPRNGRIAPGTRPDKPVVPFARNLRQARTQNGNADSAIVIALPANLQVPDTFCVSYCAYDAQGNVSNVISTCIIVNNVGPDAAGTWLNGTWKNTANWDSSVQQRDTVIYNQWSADRYSWGYACRFDSFANKYVLDYNFSNSNALVNDSVYTVKSHVTFGSNGGFSSEYHVRFKSIDLASSTCSQFAFVQSPDERDTTTGAWNYNSATDKMVAVFEFDSNGLPQLEAYEY